MYLIALQAAEQIGRARYFAGMRFIGLLLVIMLILGIAVLARKLMK